MTMTIDSREGACRGARIAQDAYLNRPTPGNHETPTVAS